MLERLKVPILLLALGLLAGGLFVLRRPRLRLALRYLKPMGQLVVPVDGVRPKHLASTFGAPRSGSRSHRGTDIFAPRGTPVLAAAEGVVYKVGLDRLGGRVVGVVGPGPAYYYYAHLDRWAEGLEEGDRVDPGDFLGYVGNTGNARTTPPHLHFGVYRLSWSGIHAVDPVPLLKGPAAAAGALAARP